MKTQINKIHKYTVNVLVVLFLFNGCGITQKNVKKKINICFNSESKTVYNCSSNDSNLNFTTTLDEKILKHLIPKFQKFTTSSKNENGIHEYCFDQKHKQKILNIFKFFDNLDSSKNMETLFCLQSMLSNFKKNNKNLIEEIIQNRINFLNINEYFMTKCSSKNIYYRQQTLTEGIKDSIYNLLFPKLSSTKVLSLTGNNTNSIPLHLPSKNLSIKKNDIVVVKKKSKPFSLRKKQLMNDFIYNNNYDNDQQINSNQTQNSIYDHDIFMNNNNNNNNNNIQLHNTSDIIIPPIPLLSCLNNNKYLIPKINNNSLDSNIDIATDEDIDIYASKAKKYNLNTKPLIKKHKFQKKLTTKQTISVFNKKRKNIINSQRPKKRQKTNHKNYNNIQKIEQTEIDINICKFILKHLIAANKEEFRFYGTRNVQTNNIAKATFIKLLRKYDLQNKDIGELESYIKINPVLRNSILKNKLFVTGSIFTVIHDSKKYDIKFYRTSEFLNKVILGETPTTDDIFKKIDSLNIKTHFKIISGKEVQIAFYPEKYFIKDINLYKTLKLKKRDNRGLAAGRFKTLNEIPKEDIITKYHVKYKTSKTNQKRIRSNHSYTSSYDFISKRNIDEFLSVSSISKNISNIIKKFRESKIIRNALKEEKVVHFEDSIFSNVSINGSPTAYHQDNKQLNFSHVPKVIFCYENEGPIYFPEFGISINLKINNGICFFNPFLVHGNPQNINRSRKTIALYISKSKHFFYYNNKEDIFKKIYKFQQNKRKIRKNQDLKITLNSISNYKKNTSRQFENIKLNNNYGEYIKFIMYTTSIKKNKSYDQHVFNKFNLTLQSSQKINNDKLTELIKKSLQIYPAKCSKKSNIDNLISKDLKESNNIYYLLSTYLNMTDFKIQRKQKSGTFIYTVDFSLRIDKFIYPLIGYISEYIYSIYFDNELICKEVFLTNTCSSNLNFRMNKILEDCKLYKTFGRLSKLKKLMLISDSYFKWYENTQSSTIVISCAGSSDTVTLFGKNKRFAPRINPFTMKLKEFPPIMKLET